MLDALKGLPGVDQDSFAVDVHRRLIVFRVQDPLGFDAQAASAHVTEKTGFPCQPYAGPGG